MALSYDRIANEYYFWFGDKGSDYVSFSITVGGHSWGYSEDVLFNDYSIQKIKASFKCDDQKCTFINALIVNDMTTYTNKIIYWSEVNDTVIFEDNWDLSISTSAELEIQWDGCFVNFASQAHWNWGGAPPPPQQLLRAKASFEGEIIDGPKRDGASYGSIDIRGSKDDLRLVSRYSSTSFYSKTIETSVYGDWAVKEVKTYPDDRVPLAGDDINVSFLPNASVDLCNISCMMDARFMLLVDDIEVPGENITISTEEGLGWHHFNWVGLGGTHNLTIRAEVDKDPDHTNNDLTIPIFIDPLPDIEVTDLVIDPGAVHPGQLFSFTYKVKNNGGNASAVRTSVIVEGEEIFNRTIFNLRPGSSKDFIGSSQIGNVSGGPHDILVEAEPIGINDSNTINNEAHAILRIYLRDLDLVMISPAEGSTNIGTLDIEGKIIDPEGLDSVVWAELWDTALIKRSENVTTSGTFNFSMDISDMESAPYDLKVKVLGDESRTAEVGVKVLVRTGVYWKELFPADGQSITVWENTSANITAVAADLVTDEVLEVDWTVEGKDISALDFFRPGGSSLIINPSYDDEGDYLVKADAANRYGTVHANWLVRVIDVNRPPVILDSDPSTGPVELTAGQESKFYVDVFDPDGDPINYTWKFDDMTLFGNGILLNSTKEGNFSLLVMITDGNASAHSSWQIHVKKEFVKEPPMKTKGT